MSGQWSPSTSSRPQDSPIRTAENDPIHLMEERAQEFSLEVSTALGP